MFGKSKKNKPNKKNIIIDEEDIKTLHKKYYMNDSIDLSNEHSQLNNQWKSEAEIAKEKREAQSRFRKQSMKMN